MRIHKTQKRTGAAPLEFALAMPVLLILFAVIWSTGYLGLGRIRLAFDNKNTAWKKRATAKSAAPLYFNKTRKYITENGSKPIRVTTFVQGPTITAKSKHFVLGGAWDYRELKPDQDLIKHGKDMVISSTGSLGAVGGILSNATSLLSNFNGSLNLQKVESDNAKGEFEEKRNKVKEEQRKVTAKRVETERKVRELEQKVATVKREIQNLKSEKKKLEDQEFKKKKDESEEDAKKRKALEEKKRQADIKRIDGEIRTKQMEQTRLEAELRQERERLKGLKATEAVLGVVP